MNGNADEILWPVELKCLSTGKPGLLFRILRQCSLDPSGFTNIKNGGTLMTAHAVCKITRLAGKMALGGRPLKMTDVCTGMATWMLTGTQVTLISICAAS